MKFIRSEKYDKEFLRENMMGPNCIKMLEDMTTHFELEKGMRVLDLGCGKGLTSIFLAKEFGVTVFATDLWITATENYMRFKEMGLEGQIIPIHTDAHDMPYADGFFDAAVSVDAYHYFGANDRFMQQKLVPLVKPGGVIAIAVPGIKEEYESVPSALAPYLSEEDFKTFHSREWWLKQFGASPGFKVETAYELDDFDELWHDWLLSDNPYAVTDRRMIAEGGGLCMNLIANIGRRV